MSTVIELLQKWERRRADHARLDSYVSAAKLINDVLADLEQLQRANALDVLTLEQAHAISGYSVGYLAKLLAEGAMANVGSTDRPRIRRGDVLVKPGYVLPPRAAPAASLGREAPR